MQCDHCHPESRNDRPPASCRGRCEWLDHEVGIYSRIADHHRKADSGTRSRKPVEGTRDRNAVTPGWVRGGGALGKLVREFDWTQTPLGAIEEWPQSLKTVVRALLTSRFAMWMSWGPELTFLYNDDYARMTLGKKHPWALGRPSREVWAEIWDDIGSSHSEGSGDR